MSVSGLFDFVPTAEEPFAPVGRVIEFFAPCVPPRTTSQMKRAARVGNGIRFFKSAKQQAAIATLEGVLLPHQPSTPVGGLVSITIEATWPWRASDLSSKARRDVAAFVKRIPSGSKPDADNFCKQTIDTLVALRFIERDELVCELTVRKFFGEEPGLRIVIKAVKN